MTDSKHTIPLGDATSAQLREYAAAFLGLDIESGRTAAAIRAAILTVSPDLTEIPVNAVHAPVQPVATPPTFGANPREVAGDDADEMANRKVRILIAKEKGKGGDEDVSVGVNGLAMRIPRGVKCDIPYKYYEALCNAVGLEYDVDANGMLMPVPREVPGYPVSFFGFA